MSTSKTYFDELAGVKVSNQLYQSWIDYALSLTRDDILRIIRGGLIHQARAINSMLREGLNGLPVSEKIWAKSGIIVRACEKAGQTIRQS